MKKALYIFMLQFSVLSAFCQEKTAPSQILMTPLSDTTVVIDCGTAPTLLNTPANEQWKAKTNESDVTIEYLKSKAIRVSANCRGTRKVVFLRYFVKKMPNPQIEDYPLIDNR